MALIVQKYGGTSVGNTDRIRNVSRRVARYREQGDQVVVVVSAMSGETNRLLAMAHDLQERPVLRGNPCPHPVIADRHAVRRMVCHEPVTFGVSVLCCI